MPPRTFHTCGHKNCVRYRLYLSTELSGRDATKGKGIGYFFSGCKRVTLDASVYFRGSEDEPQVPLTGFTTEEVKRILLKQGLEEPEEQQEEED